jgi:hypothetical protein
MAEPIIKSYPMDANAISIITNYKEAYPWLLNNFIQLTSFILPSSRLFLRFTDSFVFYKKCPFLDYQRIKKQFIQNNFNNNILDFIIDAINKGYYVYLVVNTLYISAYEPKRNSDIPHDILIFGYDIMNKIFYIADNFKYGKYSFETCTYFELENAFYNLREEDENHAAFSNSIELLSYKEAIHAKFELEIIVDGIQAYLSSRPGEWHISKALFGLQVYDYFKVFLSLLQDNEVPFDIRPFHTFWEHKFVMMLRLEFMNNKNMLNNDDGLLNSYKIIEQKALVQRNLMLKYSINQNKGILNRVLEEIEEIKFKEDIVLNKVLLNVIPDSESNAL